MRQVNDLQELFGDEWTHVSGSHVRIAFYCKLRNLYSSEWVAMMEWQRESLARYITKSTCTSTQS